MNEVDLLSLILPAGILEYFRVIGYKKEEDVSFVDLEEKNLPPEQYQDQKLLSKGFYDTVTIQDYPLRGKPFFLRIKRRRWTIEETGQVVSRDWNLVAKGTRITEEFATFLKGIN
jgi:hypothetical protein